MLGHRQGLDGLLHVRVEFIVDALAFFDVKGGIVDFPLDKSPHELQVRLEIGLLEIDLLADEELPELLDDLVGDIPSRLEVGVLPAVVLRERLDRVAPAQLPLEVVAATLLELNVGR